jgi:predicted DCC family thiol-disulfide oxidoreductase YuxK
MSDSQSARPLVLYDSDCGFCLWCTAMLLAWDRRGRLRPVALETPEADRLLSDMDYEQRMASWHLVLPGGERHSGGRAFEPLLRLLPGGRAAAAMVARFPRLANRAYYAVADHRSLPGRLVSARARERALARMAQRS